jgi:CRISPR-associated protein Cmr5
MTLRTRAQEDMLLAEELVTEVYEKEKKPVHTIYGGLCHQFPVLVRTCGLCQALAFSAAKAKTGEVGDRQRAHALLLKHVGKVLNLPQEAQELCTKVADADASQYMFYTRRVLSAWVYFKQFAVSILDVTSANEAKEEGEGEA